MPLAGARRAGTRPSRLVRRDGAVSVRGRPSRRSGAGSPASRGAARRRSVAGAAPAMAALGRVSEAMWDGWLATTGTCMTAGLFDVYPDATGLRRRRATTPRSCVVGRDRRRGRRSRPRWRWSRRSSGRWPAVCCCPTTAPSIRCGPSTRLIERVASAGGSTAAVPRADRPRRPTADRVVRAADEPRRPRRRRGGARRRAPGPGGSPGCSANRVPVIPGSRAEPHRRASRRRPARPLLLGEDHVAVGPAARHLRLSAWFQLNRYDLSVPAERIARLETYGPGPAAPRRHADRPAPVGRTATGDARRRTDHRSAVAAGTTSPSPPATR